MEQWRALRRAVAEQTVEELRKRCEPLLLGFGGSMAYGTDTPDSDIDVRGFYLNPVEEWIGLEQDSEQLVLEDSDTVVFSLKKVMGLFLSCNPNVVELLGLRREDILFSSEDGEQVLEQGHRLLSQRAVSTFGGFAFQQRRRLDALLQKEDREGKKLCKHMMHLIRVYHMGTDLLREGRVITYRDTDHALLMDIRSGGYVDRALRPTAAFGALVEQCEADFRRAAEQTRLPEQPDRAFANALTMEIVRRHL